MRLIKWGNRPEMDTIWLQKSLEEVYQPIQPRAEFVRRLGRQLVGQLPSVQSDARLEKRRLTMVVGVSLLGGALAFLMGMRTVLTLGMAMGLLMELKKPVDEQENSSVPTFE